MANYKQKLEEMATTPVIDETQFAEIVYGTEKQIEFGKERRSKVIEELNRYREAFPDDEQLKAVYEVVRTVNYATFFIDAWKHLNKEGIVDWIVNNCKALEKYRDKTVEKTSLIMDAWGAESSPTQKWVKEEEITLDHVTSILSTALYAEFMDWAEESGMNRIPSNKAFYKEISRIFNVARTDNVIRNDVKGRYFEVA